MTQLINEANGVKTWTKEITIKTCNGFTLYSLDTIYVISYYSTYQASSRSKTYKTHKQAMAAWEKIVSGETTYVTF